MVRGTALSLAVCLLLLNSLGAELSVATRGRRHYCGRDLATALSVLCEGWYKRSSAISYIDSEDPYDQGELAYQQFMSKENAVVMPGSAYRKRGGKRKGIVDECCKQSCTVSELRQYCGADD